MNIDVKSESYGIDVVLLLIKLFELVIQLVELELVVELIEIEVCCVTNFVVEFVAIGCLVLVGFDFVVLGFFGFVVVTLGFLVFFDDFCLLFWLVTLFCLLVVVDVVLASIPFLDQNIT